MDNILGNLKVVWDIHKRNSKFGSDQEFFQHLLDIHKRVCSDCQIMESSSESSNSEVLSFDDTSSDQADSVKSRHPHLNDVELLFQSLLNNVLKLNEREYQFVYQHLNQLNQHMDDGVLPQWLLNGKYQEVQHYSNAIPASNASQSPATMVQCDSCPGFFKRISGNVGSCPGCIVRRATTVMTNAAPTVRAVGMPERPSQSMAVGQTASFEPRVTMPPYLTSHRHPVMTNAHYAPPVPGPSTSGFFPNPTMGGVPLLREYKSAKRRNSTPEELERTRARERLNAAIRRYRESPEQKALRQWKDRNRKRLMRLNRIMTHGNIELTPDKSARLESLSNSILSDNFRTDGSAPDSSERMDRPTSQQHQQPGGSSHLSFEENIAVLAEPVTAANVNSYDSRSCSRTAEATLGVLPSSAVKIEPAPF